MCVYKRRQLNTHVQLNFKYGSALIGNSKQLYSCLMQEIKLFLCLTLDYIWQVLNRFKKACGNCLWHVSRKSEKERTNKRVQACKLKEEIKWLTHNSSSV